MLIGRDGVEMVPDEDVLGGRVLEVLRGCSPVCGASSAGAVPACASWVGSDLPAGPVYGGPGEQDGWLCPGQVTAERLNTRMDAAVTSSAQPARTSRLKHLRWCWSCPICRAGRRRRGRELRSAAAPGCAW